MSLSTIKGATLYAQPNAEVKKELILKDEDVLHLLHHDALQPFPVTLPEPLRSATVTRRQLAKHYGGSEMDTFPKPGADKFAVHGRANFMCINLQWNPNAPQVPGHGGLFFDSTFPGDAWTAREKHSPLQVLFVRLSGNKWLYLGEYEVGEAPALTTAQWRGLPNAVRALWTKNIHEKMWGREMRARIHLRRTLGREATRSEVNDALSLEDGSFKGVSPARINAALESGDECVRTWSMKCVGYDEDFQRELSQLPSY
ncbi:hypothetical protein C8Q78DRAFT_985175 [Trametes maxima]|nr:hypothetical protein C8Q78DRAFT_985175 [Trametes maxima]